MIEPQGRSAIKALLAAHDLHPRRRLGQHFLADPNIVRKIVELIDRPSGTPVLEIGAGTGTLTRALAGAGYRVVAYEIDRRLEPILAEQLEGIGDVDLRIADASSVDFEAELSGPGWVLAANLPYHVGTPLVLDLLRTAMRIERFVVMVQREVADRLVATPGSRRYGLPSVIAQLYGTPERAFTIGPQVFVPPPAVESAVVTIDRRPAAADAARAVDLAEAAFGQRRKTLRRSLESAGLDAARILAAAGIPAGERPEHLTPEDFLRLAAATRV